MVDRLRSLSWIELRQLKPATVFAFGSSKVHLMHIRDFGAAVFDQTHDLCVEPNRFFEIVYCDTKLTNC